MKFLLVAVALVSLHGPLSAADRTSPAKAKKLCEEFAKAVEAVNRKHLPAPGENTESELAKKLPRALVKGLDGLLKMEDGPAKWDALLAFATAAAELDMIDEIERIEKALGKRAPEAAARLGHYISRPRFLLHAVRVSDSFAEEFAAVFEGILSTYDRVFGFAEFSKVPGKKIRVELHQEKSPRAPHFAPQYPFHSTVDFPVAAGAEFTSPTRDGKFLFYGLCHELGHLIAMWGDRRNEEDHHAWAHYTGVVIVSASAKAPWAKRMKDLRWRSVEIDGKKLADTAPSRKDRDGVLKMLLVLHETVGPKKIGDALNLMDEKRMGHRINQVRYYSLDEFRKALLAGCRSRKEKARLNELCK